VGEGRKAFAPQEVGAVQMGVRINNRFGSLLARMQDMEFVIFTEVFQRGRRRVHSVGMGATAPSVRVEEVWRDGPTIWFTAKAWGYLAENLAHSLHKGDPVVLVGRFSQDAWENDRGQQLTNVLTVSCGGPDLTWGESRFMRVARTAQAIGAADATTSAGSAPSSASADTASESEGAAVGLRETPLEDAHWETLPDELTDRPEPSADPMAYTLREEALV